MRVSCPGCYETADFDPGPDGCRLRCSLCGTAWFARRRVDNPYAHGRVLPTLGPPADSHRQFIDHVGQGFDQAAHCGPTMPAIRARRWPFGRLTAAVLMIIAAVMVARVPIVAAFPERLEVSAPLARNDLLQFRRVRSERSAAGGVHRLTVEGELFNPTRRTLALPSVQIDLRDDDGRTVHSWRIDLARVEINGGDKISFRSAVIAPPEDASEVNLTLAPRLGRPANKS